LIDIIVLKLQELKTLFVAFLGKNIVNPKATYQSVAPTNENDHT
jgi:hypothetical protein